MLSVRVPGHTTVNPTTHCLIDCGGVKMERRHAVHAKAEDGGGRVASVWGIWGAGRWIRWRGATPMQGRDMAAVWSLR
jgi:hypothetical protein